MKLDCVQVVVLSLILVGITHGASTDNCSLASEHGEMTFPVDRLTAESRCLLADVIDDPSASGVIGPDLTPIGADLYEYLLDHPTVTAMLMQGLGMGTFQITAKGPNRYWVDDGDGAEGLLSLLFQDTHSRIYYIDGQHRSPLFPTIKAKTAVFMRIMPGPTIEGHSVVQTILMSYTRFEDGMLIRLMRLLKPLVARAVTRTLTKEFSMTHRLGMLIAEEPQRVLQETARLSSASSKDRQALLTLLQAQASPSNPSNAAP